MSRKCYYTYVAGVGRVSIPNCWPVVWSDDISDCTCAPDSFTYQQFEKQSYNEKLKEAKTLIDTLIEDKKDLITYIEKIELLLHEHKIDIYQHSNNPDEPEYICPTEPDTSE